MNIKYFLISVIIGLSFVCLAMVRYPVGKPVPSDVYTASFEQDDIYKFLQTDYGEPNKPKLQSAPDDWIEKFGDNERTLLFHTISELRVVVANQGKRIVTLTDRLDKMEAKVTNLEQFKKDLLDPNNIEPGWGTVNCAGDPNE